MNYYIDFDHTLYNTNKLTQEMLSSISTNISKKNNYEYSSILEECKKMFTHEHIYNIYKLCDYFSEKYDIKPTILKNDIHNILANCEKNVYEDSIEFLRNLKEKKHKIFMLSYYGHELQYQIAKISGSKLADYFDGIFITKEAKYKLDIDYGNGIFIDDNPKDLEGLYSQNPIEVIRIKRKNTTYSLHQLNNPNIKVYESLSDIIIL